MLKTLIIGAGDISCHHCAALSKIKEVKLAGVYDINRDNAEKLASEFGSRVADDLETAIRDVDMVHLLTPPSARAEYATLAMRHGKHVFAESPIALSLPDALFMELLAEKTKVKYMVAFTQRFRKGYELMKETCQSGALGDAVQFVCVRIGPGPGFDGKLSESWRTNPNLVCGMSIESLSNDIDFITSILGGVEDVQASVSGTIATLPAFDNNSSAVLRMKNGGSASIAASWSSAIAYNCKTLIGTKGTITLFGDSMWGFSTAKAAFSDGTQWQRTLDDVFPDDQAYRRENEYFVSCVLNDTQPHCGATAGREALEISLAMLESSKEKRLVTL